MIEQKEERLPEGVSAKAHFEVAESILKRFGRPIRVIAVGTALGLVFAPGGQRMIVVATDVAAAVFGLRLR